MSEYLEPVVGAEEIAKHLGVSKRQIVDRVSKQKGFPYPINIKPLKWLAKDINEWMRKATQ